MKEPSPKESLIKALRERLVSADFLDESLTQKFLALIARFESNRIGAVVFCLLSSEYIQKLTVPDINGFCWDETGPELVDQLEKMFINYVPTEFFKARLLSVLPESYYSNIQSNSLGFGLLHKSLIQKIALSSETEMTTALKKEYIAKINQIASEYYSKIQDGRKYFKQSMRLKTDLPYLDFKSPCLMVLEFLEQDPQDSVRASVNQSFEAVMTRLMHSRDLSRQQTAAVLKKWIRKSGMFCENMADFQMILETFKFKINMLMLIDQFMDSCSGELLQELKKDLIETKDLEAGFERVCRFVPQSEAEKLLLSEVEEACLNYFNIFNLPVNVHLDDSRAVTKENISFAGLQFFAGIPAVNPRAGGVAHMRAPGNY